MTFPPSNKEFLNSRTFECIKCGECCRPLVLLSEEDIKRIETFGIKETEFIDVDPLGKKTHKVLQQKNHVCMFLKKEGEEFICSIHNLNSKELP